MTPKRPKAERPSRRDWRPDNTTCPVCGKPCRGAPSRKNPSKNYCLGDAKMCQGCADANTAKLRRALADPEERRARFLPGRVGPMPVSDGDDGT